jgi:hypothetical protein
VITSTVAGILVHIARRLSMFVNSGGIAMRTHDVFHILTAVGVIM